MHRRLAAALSLAALLFAAPPAHAAWTTEDVATGSRDSGTFLSASDLEPKGGWDSNGNAVAVWAEPLASGYRLRSARRPADGAWGDFQTVAEPAYATFGTEVDRSGAAFHLGVEPDGTAVVVFTDGTAARFASNTPGGPGWGIPEALSTPGDDRIDDLTLAQNRRGDMIAAWEAHQGGSAIDARVYSAIGGWGPVTQVSGLDESVLFPSVAMDENGTAMVTYQGSAGLDDVYRAAFKAASETAFTNPEIIAVEPPDGGFLSGDASVVNGRAAVAWYQSRPESPGKARRLVTVAHRGANAKWAVQQLNRDSEEAIFPELEQGPNGEATVTWEVDVGEGYATRYAYKGKTGFWSDQQELAPAPSLNPHIARGPADEALVTVSKGGTLAAAPARLGAPLPPLADVGVAFGSGPPVISAGLRGLVIQAFGEGPTGYRSRAYLYEGPYTAGAPQNPCEPYPECDKPKDTGCYPTPEDCEPPPPAPPDKPPAPSSDPSCAEHKLTFGPIEMVGSCIKREDKIFTTTGTLRVNGLDLGPVGKPTAGGNAKIIIDPLERTISGNASVGISLRGRSLGRMKSFSFKIPSPGVEPSFGVDVADEFLIGALPAQGKAKITLHEKSASGELFVKLPPVLGSFTGNLTFKADMDNGLKFEDLLMTIENVFVGPVLIKRALAQYNWEKDSWRGEGGVVLPTPTSATVDGGISFEKGRFKYAFASANGLNIALSREVYLQRIRARVDLDPLFLGGGLGLSAGGGQIKVKGTPVEPVSIDGDASYRFSTPGIFNVSGSLGLMGVQLVDGFLTYVTPSPGYDFGQVTFGGGLSFPPPGVEVPGVSASAKLAGAVYGIKEMEASGKGSVKLPLVGNRTGELLVSTKGVAACVTGLPWGSSGFGYAWSTGALDVMARSCGMSDYKIAGASQAGGERRVVIPGGLRSAALQVTGTPGAPAFDLRAPNGQTIAVTGPALTSTYWIYGHGPSRSTYVTLGRPQGGTWTIIPRPGPAIVSVRTAQALPEPRVSATVRRRKDKRVLTYRVRGPRGQVVTFVERGGGSSRTLARVRGSKRGRTSFRPAPGRGRRQIIALIAQDGMPRDERRVGSYGAPRLRRPGKPRAVRIAKRSGRLRVAWKAAPRARRYIVRLTLSDGRREQFITGRRSVAVRLGAARRARVTVAAFTPPKTIGPSAGARFPAKKPRRR